MRPALDEKRLGYLIHHLLILPITTFFCFGSELLIYLFNFFLWMNILSKIDLSVALPLAGSSYILIPIAAVFFLHEFVTPMRWLGLVLIVLGIYFISTKQILLAR